MVYLWSSLTPSQPRPKPLLQPVPIAAAERQAGAIVEQHRVFTVKEWLQFLHAIEVDDGTAVDAREPTWVEAVLELTECIAYEVCVFARVHPHVVVGSFQPVDLFGPQEQNPPIRFDGDPDTSGHVGFQL